MAAEVALPLIGSEQRLGASVPIEQGQRLHDVDGAFLKNSRVNFERFSF